jgi:hypothetical protein
MFQVGACVQADAAAAAEAGTLQQRWPGNDISGRCNSENQPGFIPAFSDSQGGKILVGLESGRIRRQALCASRVVQRNHLVHYGVQRVALAIAFTSTGGRSRSRDPAGSPNRDFAARQFCRNGAGDKRKNNFGGNIAEAKSKLRCEHHRLSHRRIGRASSLLQLMNGNLIRDGVFSQYRSGNPSEEASNCGTDEDRKTGLWPVRQTVSAC